MFGIPGQHVLNVINSGNYPDVVANLIEECSELIQVLAKHNNHLYDEDFDYYRNRVIEEITHVLVSINMVCPLLNISEEDIKKEVISKAIKDGFDMSQYKL